MDGFSYDFSKNKSKINQLCPIDQKAIGLKNAWSALHHDAYYFVRARF
jgi:hypothetical protein